MWCKYFGMVRTYVLYFDGNDIFLVYQKALIDVIKNTIYYHVVVEEILQIDWCELTLLLYGRITYWNKYCNRNS